MNPREWFDRLRLAVKLLGVPVSFISVVDGARDFYVSQSGFGEPLASLRSLEGRTFCHFGLLSEGPLVVDDTTAGEPFASVPTVQSLGGPGLSGGRFECPGRPPPGQLLRDRLPATPLVRHRRQRAHGARPGRCQ